MSNRQGADEVSVEAEVLLTAEQVRVALAYSEMIAGVESVEASSAT